MKRKSVVLVAGVFPPGVGGMQKYYYNLSKYSKHKMTVVAPHYPGDAAFDAEQPYQTVRGDFLQQETVHLSSWPRLFRMVKRTVREEKADVTLYGYILIGIIGLILKKWKGCKYAISTHGMDMLQFRKIWGLNKLVSLILQKADGVLTNSEFTKALVLDYGVNPARIQLVYPGVEDVYEKQQPSQTLIDEYGLAGKYKLLTVGRLVRRKGHDKVIESMPAILEAIPNAVYVIAGDGPERKRLEQLARDRGVAEQVVFTGYVKDLAAMNAFYNTCDQFLMVSRELEQGDAEGFGIVYLEAAMTGIPVIAGKSGGVGEAVLDGETGVLVDPQSPTAIADAVVRLARDEALREELASAGYERARSQFRYAQLAERFDRAMSAFCAPAGAEARASAAQRGAGAAGAAGKEVGASAGGK
ncbi:glycosyltransferase family 4 protein [Paenibacillus koleovorans]|uniref:glycosyltransferase family 4 protein n=1 Tax=Paenibacillus koleovorans TaxID=121608 RepID=UPI000FD72634|nr:glycosyltransferase family 4 protein [Paenibacillus koleovorans]